MAEQLYTDLLHSGLSAKTVRHTHAFLGHALQDAERLGLIVRNPAWVAKAPRVHQKNSRHRGRNSSASSSNSTVSERFHPVFLYLAAAGLSSAGRSSVCARRTFDLERSGPLRDSHLHHSKRCDVVIDGESGEEPPACLTRRRVGSGAAGPWAAPGPGDGWRSVLRGRATIWCSASPTVRPCTRQAHGPVREARSGEWPASHPPS